MSHTNPATALTLTEKVAEYRKAIAALLVPPLALLGFALLEVSPGQTAVTASEWVGIAVAGLTGSAVVAAVRNGAKPE